MDSTGLITIGFLSNDYINLVSVGEKHFVYEVGKEATIHRWLNTQILENADIVVEDLYLNDNTGTKSILPRYFKVAKIYSSDDVREEFMMLDTDAELLQIETQPNLPAALFLKAPCTDPVLKKLDMSVIKNQYKRYIHNFAASDEVIKVPEFTSTSPGLAYFIEEAHKYGNVYDRLVNPGRILNTNTLIEKVREFKDPNKLVNLVDADYEIDESILKVLYVYELCLFQYIRYNFIYRVARWINKYSNVPLDAGLYNKINGYIDDAHYKNRFHTNADFESSLTLQSIMFDYVAILKILDLYDTIREKTTTNLLPENKQLIWLNAGAYHNAFTELFLTAIFKEIRDVLEHKYFAGREEVDLETDDVDATITKDFGATESSEFTEFVAANPHFGLIDYRIIFDVSQIGTYREKDGLLEKFKEMIKLAYRHVPDKQLLTNLLDNLDVTTLQLLIPMILSESLHDNVDLTSILNKSTEELNNLGILLNNRINPALQILKNLKTLTQEEINSIPRHFIIEYMNDDSSVSFKHLSVGAQLLSITNNKESIGSEVSPTILELDPENIYSIDTIYDYDDYIQFKGSEDENLKNPIDPEDLEVQTFRDNAIVKLNELYEEKMKINDNTKNWTNLKNVCTKQINAMYEKTWTQERNKGKFKKSIVTNLSKIFNTDAVLGGGDKINYINIILLSLMILLVLYLLYLIVKYVKNEINHREYNKNGLTVP
jgi:hypothetical protein